MSPAPPEPAPSLPDRLALIIAALCSALAVRCARQATMAPIGLLLWRRLQRTAARFKSLFARWREGRLPPPRPHPKRERTPRAPAPRLPGGFAWLVKIMPEAAAFGSQLQHLLADPDVAGFLAEAPQAARMFRPLCRMLGVRPLPDRLQPSPHGAPPPDIAGRAAPARTVQTPPAPNVGPADHSRPRPPGPCPAPA